MKLERRRGMRCKVDDLSTNSEELHNSVNLAHICTHTNRNVEIHTHTH